MEVKLDEEIEAEVTIELLGIEEAPGVKEGGVLEHVTHEITIRALPTAIPESIGADVSGMEINDTLQLSALTPPEGVEFVLAEDAEELTIATLSPPRVEEEPEPELEEEAELVGEEGEEPGRRGRGRALRRCVCRRGRLRRGIVPSCGVAGGSGVPFGQRLGPRDVLLVGLGNPGREYAATRHNIGFEVGAELSRRWDLPRAQERFRGADRRGQGRCRRPPCRDPPPADLHERVRRLGGAGARGPQGPARPHNRRPRRDRPAVRRGALEARRRRCRAQRAEEPQAGVRQPGFLAGPVRALAAPTPPTPRSSPRTSSRAFASPAPRCAT